MRIQTIGVIGAGVMGQGVSYQFAKYGYKIILLDISNEILESAKNNIRNIGRLDVLLNKAAAPSSGNILDNIKSTLELTDMSAADFIIENSTENIDLKESIYKQLKNICRPDTCIAVNTSAISITRIGSMLKHPDTVLGIHFMNPVHLKPTVEVIKGYHTDEETINIALELLHSVNMAGVVVNDFPGFVSNRILMLTINEAIFVLQDGVATVANIDKIFKECFGHKMGPLETGDLIGLDTILYTLDVLMDSYNDSKFRAAPLLKKMVDANLLGRKNGEGFYKY
ncbi:MAG: 3-hydroxyacyl-CoA dehydrogenase family protein [Chitinophagaceae bacterium]